MSAYPTKGSKRECQANHRRGKGSRLVRRTPPNDQHPRSRTAFDRQWRKKHAKLLGDLQSLGNTSNNVESDQPPRPRDSRALRRTHSRSEPHPDSSSRPASVSEPSIARTRNTTANSTLARTNEKSVRETEFTPQATTPPAQATPSTNTAVTPNFRLLQLRRNNATKHATWSSNRCANN
ncbi:unnamed protein product [Microthlaspi erraticum]|uniref:Uncharacterized protein n=1 Tax=Microthlaspi erraticum TaxID=1685480 RepID=A0A6D2KLZ8_9BRAS|nr:unnamed protein product [Microthlaspi erraticum]